MMKKLSFPLFIAAALFLNSCGSSPMPVAELSASEQNLLSAINGYRAAQGKSALKPEGKLTELARKDAARRASSGGGYVDNRQKTGYERMLTLAGTAREGDAFGGKLMEYWQRNPAQRQWLSGNYSGVGVGTALGESNLQTGVLLLGGFAGGI